MKNNKAEVYWRILYNQLVKDSCECQENFCVINLIEETRKISVFLQEKFKGSKLNKEYIFYIFEEVLKRLSDYEWANEKYYNKKVIYILLDYIKENFFCQNIEIWEKLFKKYLNNPSIKPYILDYLKELNNCIYNSSIEPYVEIDFSLYIQWISEKYDIISDIHWGDFKWIKKFLDSKIEKIKDNENTNENYLIDELCVLFKTLNQLGIVLNIWWEQRKVWINLYKYVLIDWIKKTNATYLKWINKTEIDELLNSQDNILFSERIWHLLTPKQIGDLNKFQNIYWKFLCNFEWNVDYNQVINNTWTIDDTVIEINTITKNAQENIKYWLKLTEISSAWNKSWEDLFQSTQETKVISELSIIYLNLKRLKQTIRILEFNWNNPDLRESVKNEIAKHNKEKAWYAKKIISLYKSTIDDKINSDINSVIKHFISNNNPSNNQLTIIYNLVISWAIDIWLLQTLIKRLIDIGWIRSISFEKYKLQTIEAIIWELWNKTTLCEFNCTNYTKCWNNNRDEKICRDLIWLIENFINSLKNSPEQKWHYFVFNYWKLYLSLAYLFSLWEKPELIQKAKEYFAIFQEKYSYALSNYWKSNGKSIDYENLETENRKRIIIKNIKSREESLYSIEGSIKDHIESDTQQRRMKIEEVLFDIILKIQKQKWEYDQKEWERIKAEICNIISVSLFDGFCEISIVDKWEEIIPWRSDNIEIIESDSSDINIVFRYNSLYEDNFRYLFEKEKEFIKEKLMLFIASNNDYLTISEDFITMIWFIGKLMESKDTYTKWHIQRVTDFSLVVWKILGWSIPDLSRLRISSMIHDIGKVDWPDKILKKSWKITPEERLIIDMHSWNWILEWINIGINKKYLEWMPHHNKFYSEQCNETLIYDELIKSIEKGHPIDVMDFKRLAWNNIPYTARIIMIWDAIDAIASRRIYDDRASMKIGELLDYIDHELLICSWLKRMGDQNIITVDENAWQEVDIDEELDNVYRITINSKYYIPTKKVDIIFDASIIYALMNDEESYSQIKMQIKNSDKKNVHQKVIEIENNIIMLKERLQEYQEIIKDIRFYWWENIRDYFKDEWQNINDAMVDWLMSSLLKNDSLLLLIEKSNQIKIAFTSDNQNELIRLNWLQVQMRELEEYYRKN